MQETLSAFIDIGCYPFLKDLYLMNATLISHLPQSLRPVSQ